MKEKKATAFVYGMTFNGLSVLRSLGRKGIVTYGLDSDPSKIGFFSRYCHHKVLLSSVNDKPLCVLDELIGAAKKLDHRPVLFFTRDDFLVFLSIYRQDLEEYFIFNAPERKVVDCIIDKRRLAQHVAKFDIPHPRTFVADTSEELLRISPTLRYPVVIKPPTPYLARTGNLWGGQKLLVVSDPNSLQEHFLEFKNSGLDVMIQEQVPGPDNGIYLFYTYYSKKSEPLAIFTKRKLRQYPIHHGYGCANESIWEPRVAELGRKLFDSLKYRGIGGAEFKRHSQEGGFQLIEIHGRTPMTGEIAIASGVDIPWIAYRDLVGEKIETNREFRQGVKWFNLKHDFAAYRMYRKQGELSLRDWIKSYRGKRVYAVFNPADFRPSLQSLVWHSSHKLKSIFSKTVSSLKSLISQSKTENENDE